MNCSGMIRVVATAMGVAGVMSPALAAQQVRLVPEGDTVRVWARAFDLDKTKATVLGWSSSTVLFERLSVPDSLVVPFGGITRLDHLQGKDKGLGIRRGLGIGGGLGVLVGLLVGQLAVADCREFLCELDALSYVAGGGAIGALVGAGVGAGYPPDRWNRVQLPVAAGFPAYKEPFYKSFAFQLVSAAVGIVAVALIN